MKKKQNNEEKLVTVAESDPVSLKTFSNFSQKIEEALADMRKEQSKDFLNLDGKINYDRDKVHTRINSVQSDVDALVDSSDLTAKLLLVNIVVTVMLLVLGGMHIATFKKTYNTVAAENAAQQKQIQFLLEEDDALRAGAYQMRGELNAADTQIKSLTEKVYGKTK